MTDAAQAVQDYLLELLASTPDLQTLAAEDQIRAASDQQDPEMGAAAVIVDVRDLGSHMNLPGRTLVDVSAQVEVRTSLSEDRSQARFRVYCEAAADALASIEKDTPIEGWDIRHASFPGEDALAQDSMYRYQSFQVSFILQVQ